MKSVKCSQSFINDNTITYRPHKRKSTRPFARYTKEAYICLPKKQTAIMVQQDIRWIQRFSNYRKALAKLSQAMAIMSEQLAFNDGVDELLQEGMIQRFEYTHELAWKVMKDYAEYHGYTDIRGSRDAIRKALEMGLIDDKQWMETIEARNLTSHNYDNDVVSEIYENITNFYFPLFCRFEEKMQSLNTPSLFD